MSKRSAIVADLVVDTLAAAGEAVALHYFQFLGQSREVAGLAKIALALDHGYEVDLDDYSTRDQQIGFNHQLVSALFRRRLSTHDLQRKRLSHHIWEADEDSDLFSLFGRDPNPTKIDPRSRKTRASAIVQRAMRDCRLFRHAEKATTADPSSLVTVPSPLYVAAQILTDPYSAPSKTYSTAALQEWIREALEESSGRKIDTSFAAVSDALVTINNRWKTSKPILSNRAQNGSTTIFLCNLFAIHGYMAMRFELNSIIAQGEKTEQPEPQIDVEQFFLNSMVGTDIGAEGKVEFTVNPHYEELPAIGTVMNLIDGLPIPIEGAQTIFQGGIRFSSDKSIVIALSGTFGAGKTLFGLSLAAALAPLGCRTLFLSCEERADDITARLLEAAPPALFRTAPLFSAVTERDFQRERRDPSAAPWEVTVPWFLARQLTIEQPAVGSSGVVDPASALRDMLETTLKQADFFKELERGHKHSLPHFARPIVIVDGLHRLFDLPESQEVIESSLRNLVERCRTLGAVFIFSFSSEAGALKRLDYLCDFIVELAREGFENPADTPRRHFRLLKARRQPAHIGAHAFHLKGDQGFRLKPSVLARVQEANRESWWEPDPRAEIFLTDDAPRGFRHHSTAPGFTNNLAIRNRSQVLVIGKGSSGKAGFGLYLLHRRWFDRRMFANEEDLQLTFFEDRQQGPTSQPEGLSMRKRAIGKAGLFVSYDVPSLETRVLVISFLYPSSYYDELTNRLAAKRLGRPSRSKAHYGPVEKLDGFDFNPLPDRMKTHTIELYPGQLSVEDFIAKIEKELSAAETIGLPYTGVLVDGLHNVFVQFPALESESSFWGMFFNILRTRRITVVTTHTGFDIHGAPDDSDGTSQGAHPLMVYDFEQAQRKIAPLLSALVSGADCLFELSPQHEGRHVRYRMTNLGSIGYDVGPIAYNWEKEKLRLVEVVGSDRNVSKGRRLIRIPKRS
jgi:hypothetical protein